MTLKKGVAMNTVLDIICSGLGFQTQRPPVRQHSIRRASPGLQSFVMQELQVHILVSVSLRSPSGPRPVLMSPEERDIWSSSIFPVEQQVFRVMAEKCGTSAEPVVLMDKG